MLKGFWRFFPPCGPLKSAVMMVTTKKMQFCSIKQKYIPKHRRVYPVITGYPPASYRGVLKLSMRFKDIFDAHFT